MLSKTLWCKSRSGKLRFWSIDLYDAEDDSILIEIQHGVEGGEVQFVEDYVYEGLAGRTIEEQALLRANAKIKSKMDSGYLESREVAESKDRVNSLGLPRQMLAKPLKNIESLKNDFNYEQGVYAQRKYNGYRCTIFNHDGMLVAYTRKGIVIDTIDHILDKIVIPVGTGLDGELYRHGMTLQKISSLVKKQQKETENIKFIFYDIIDNKNFAKRFEKIKDFEFVDHETILIAETIKINSIDEAFRYRDEFISEGYEGAIIRTNNLPYEEGARSASVWKLKKFLDDEFYVIDIISSKNNWAILSCVAKNGKRFEVSAPGTIKQKEQILLNRAEYIGKFINVEYSELTPYGIPFHPVAKYFRSDI